MPFFFNQKSHPKPKYENAVKSFKSIVQYKASRNAANAKLIAKQLEGIDKTCQSSGPPRRKRRRHPPCRCRTCLRVKD